MLTRNCLLLFVLLLIQYTIHPTIAIHNCHYYNSDTQPPNDTPPESGADAGGLTDADINSNWHEVIETFDGMELPEALLRGIYSYGFEKPSAIQQRAIRPAISGKDLIAQAQSGTVSFRVSIVFEWHDGTKSKNRVASARKRILG